jgi:glucan phosphoethanolaminetransferase (alkaline phosphatase superfamily)
MDLDIIAKICLFLLTITALSYIYHQGFFKITIDQKYIHESHKKTSMNLLPRYLEQAKILIVAFPRL